MSDFEICVRLAEPFREGVGSELWVREPVATLGELLPLLMERVPSLKENYDDGFVFAVNGEVILHGTRGRALKSGDEVELMLALAGG